MADLILGPLMQIVVEKLASPLLQKFQDRHNLKDNIRKLQQSVPRIQALLEDAQKQQQTRLAVKQWLVELEEAALESEVLLDELAAEMKARERRSSTKGKEVAGGLMFFPFKPSDHLFELATQLQNKLRELDQIAEQAFSFDLHEKAAERMNESSGSRETMSCLLDDNVYGREEDKHNVLNFLLHGATKCPSVISVVGIGGVGKTTLAQLVYGDEMVDSHFELKLGIHVSDDFDMGKLMRSVVESATKNRYELSGLDNLQSQLRDSLKGKRFLLVLDDVWNEDGEKWRKFINLFKVGAEGSRVLITTRSQGTASITNSTVYELKGLANAECWKLFKEIAFLQGEDGANNRLVEIGKEIIKKCGGIPLAVRALASLLKSKKEEYWISVQDSELWQFEAYQSAVMPALKLSYQYLPSHLKRCLAFCSLFPRDHEIPRGKMIYIWMAHGLILPDGGTRQLEVIGGEYFDDLLNLSFFQEVDQKHEVYKMHDLIYDLVRTVAGYGFSVLGQGLAPIDLERIHHLSMVCSSDPSSLPERLFGTKHLRTLLLLSPGGSSNELTPFWPVNFIYLKVLDLSGYGLKKLDEKVSALLCLRYLDLSSNPIQTLPRTICDLYFLQTLNLFECQHLVELPFEIAKVSSLRHLNIKGCEALTHMPAKVGELVHLQTLPIYIVGKRAGDSIAQLEFLNLRNELSIKCMENVRDSEEAKKANMKEKKHLKSLKLQWGSSSGSKDFRPEIGASSNSSLSFEPEEDDDDVETILKYLEPHSHLKTLHVKGYPGRNFPAWNLPNLTMVELINCRRSKNLPKLGHLPFLERLHLQGMDSITHISEAFYGGVAEPFPSLNYLTIRDFPYLEEWFSISKGVPFPRLEELVLDKCPKLTIAPSFPSIKNLELHHCNANIMKSMETATFLSTLMINELPELESLSGTFLQNNYSLKSLEIHSCQNLLLLPTEIEKLTSLKSLTISCCEKLGDLPPGLRKLNSLELLEINGCHSLKMLPHEEIEGLSSLKTLSIENCRNLFSFSGGFDHLIALEQLSIMNCPELTSLPDGFHNLSSLRSLHIESCPALADLPVSLQHATELQSLVIHSCVELTALPEWFSRFSSLRSLAIVECRKLMSLPEGIQRLTKLQLLSIQECPILEDRCKRKGIFWRRIEHIPHKYIGSMKL
ncbi:hypothetical protein C2S53_002997 [Perilla frutescens var. hirtella]|uniref:Uncharacterized protein n=1 Tax=Perilla frutescens var. hirtella TaxID=608512 RepID=A0AAD4JHC3_PERFH|nr:hypothetical protein C2S53_002997 [Perilla frutescens var. hirtella]